MAACRRLREADDSRILGLTLLASPGRGATNTVLLNPVDEFDSKKDYRRVQNHEITTLGLTLQSCCKNQTVHLKRWLGSINSRGVESGGCGMRGLYRTHTFPTD